MRILLVSQVNPKVFSGGRYHAFMIAEAFASLGHEPVYWTNAQPLFWDDLAAFPDHDKVELHLEDWNTPPEGEFDFVFIVPDTSPSPEMYETALQLAKNHGARTGLINFESPNWYNSTAPVKRDVSKWKNWFASSRYCDLILSSAAESTKFARDFYVQTPAWANFRHAYPSINSAAADQVWELDVPAEKRIMVISRFGGSAAHKGISDVEVLATSELEGYEVVCIVGTGAIPKEAEVEAMRSKFSAVGMTLSFLHGVSDVHKFQEIARSSVMVFPTYFEGFGYPPIEALYMGRPCVTYDLDVLREVSGDLLTYAPIGDRRALLKSTLAAIEKASEKGNTQDKTAIMEVATLEGFSNRLKDIVEDIAKIGTQPAATSFLGAFSADDYEDMPFVHEEHRPQAQPDAVIKEAASTSDANNATQSTENQTFSPKFTDLENPSFNKPSKGILGFLVRSIESLQTFVFSKIFISRVNVIQRLMQKPNQRLRLIAAIQRDKDFFDEIGHLWIKNSKNKQIALTLMGDPFEVKGAGPKLFQRAIKKKLKEHPDEVFLDSLKQLRSNSDARRRAFHTLDQTEDGIEYLLNTVVDKIGASTKQEKRQLIAKALMRACINNKLLIENISREDMNGDGSDSITDVVFKALERNNQLVLNITKHLDKHPSTRSLLVEEMASNADISKYFLGKLAQSNNLRSQIWQTLEEYQGEKEALLNDVSENPEYFDSVLQSYLLRGEADKEAHFINSFLNSTYKDSGIRSELLQRLVEAGLSGRTQKDTLSSLSNLLAEYSETGTLKSQEGLSQFTRKLFENKKLGDVGLDIIADSSEYSQQVLESSSKKDGFTDMMMNIMQNHPGMLEAVSKEVSVSTYLSKEILVHLLSNRAFFERLENVLEENPDLLASYKEDIISSSGMLQSIFVNLAKTDGIAGHLDQVFQKYPLRERAFFKEFLTSTKHRESALQELFSNPKALKETLDDMLDVAGFDMIWKIIREDENMIVNLAGGLAKGHQLSEFIEVLMGSQHSAKQLQQLLEAHHNTIRGISGLEQDTRGLNKFLAQPEVRKRMSVLSQTFVLWRRLHPHLKDSVKSEAVFANIVNEVGTEEDIWPAIIHRIVENDILRLQDGNLKVCTHGDLRVLIQEILLTEEYFFETEQASPVIIDGGANFGLAVYYFKKLYPTAVIKAFEPGRGAYSALKENIIRNGWTDVKAYPYALWKEDGEMTFSEPVEMSMGGALSTRIADRGYEVENYQVPVRKLSEFIDGRVDFLKLDIEGAEVGVLQEIEHKLNLVQNLFIEIHGGNEEGPPTEVLQKILKILDRNNYESRVSQATASSLVRRPMKEVEKRSSLTLWANRQSN